MKLLVTAGGQGTKLWPFSRENKPKQFQTIVENTTLFKYTVDLLLKQYSPLDIVISTKEKYLKFVKEQAPEIPSANIILEPDISLNRGPGEGFAFLWLDMHYPDEVFTVVQADDLRKPEERYLQMLVEIEKLAKRDKKFITGGQKENSPVLGVDYLQYGKKADIETSEEIYEIVKFIERPTHIEELKELVVKDQVANHTNHNTWYPELMLNAYHTYRPDWYEKLMQIKEVMDDPQKINEIYCQMAAGATEEVTKHVFADGYVILLPYTWVDIGSWLSVHDYLIKSDEVYTEGNVIAINSKSSVIKGKQKLIALLGMQNLIVVETDDAILITDKNHSGDVKKVLDQLKESNQNQYL